MNSQTSQLPPHKDSDSAVSETSSRASAMKILKFVVAWTLLLGLFFYVGGAELLHSLGQISLYNVFMLTWISVVLIWVSSLKWQLFIRASGHDSNIWHLMKLYTIGYFFNMFMPSSYGGDVVRSYQLGSKLGSQREAFVATFMERFTGLMTMSLSGVLFVLLGNRVTAGVEFAVLAVGLSVFVLSLACFSRVVSDFGFSLLLFLAKRLRAKRLDNFLEGQIEKLSLIFAQMREKKNLLWKALLLSVVYHAFTIVNTKASADAVGWDTAPWGGLFVVVPLVLLVSVLPLTPNGLGLQEGAFLFFLERIGATKPEALAVGVILRAKVTILGLIGGVLWITEKRKIAPEKGQ